MKNMKKMTMQAPTTHHHRRINHRRLELGLHLGKLLEMVRHAPQHFHQRTALLARAHHVDIQIRENTRLPRHRVRQTPALGDFLFQIAADLGGNALGFQMRHAVQRHRQRHAGVEQVRQLLRERGQFLQLRFAFLSKLRAQRRRQEREQIHVLPVALLAAGGCARLWPCPRRWEKARAAGFASSAAGRSATSRTPSTSSPERRRALYENCGISPC